MDSKTELTTKHCAGFCIVYTLKYIIALKENEVKSYYYCILRVSVKKVHEVVFQYLFMYRKI